MKILVFSIVVRFSSYKDKKKKNFKYYSINIELLPYSNNLLGDEVYVSYMPINYSGLCLE